MQVLLCVRLQPYPDRTLNSASTVYVYVLGTHLPVHDYDSRLNETLLGKAYLM